MEEYIKITVQEYEDLKRNSFQLQCLENAGVDNWSGYSYAMEEFIEHYDED